MADEKRLGREYVFKRLRRGMSVVQGVCPGMEVIKVINSGSSGKCVLFINHVGPLFHRAGRGDQPPNPLSLWEKGGVRESLKRQKYPILVQLDKLAK